ncbi:hypothetical protein XBI1_1090003 [Xenorhabdus bovienii str. Intermedium]|uniref:Uncharacterized protein n=1 Tax=Xenorhabdus bovienii str. Intermedium TaxID=1379677 RepID=A0A077QCI9_XENBV|nr:hypothetical protein XBI1_1090003 [Xenorhabdus bovienii str. Intermedium]
MMVNTFLPVLNIIYRFYFGVIFSILNNIFYYTIKFIYVFIVGYFNYQCIISISKISQLIIITYVYIHI